MFFRLLNWRFDSMLNCVFCLALLATPGFAAQQEDADDEVAVPLTAWTDVRAEGRLRILGIIRVDAERDLVFESAVYTGTPRIVPKFDGSAEGLAEIENGEASRAIYPVILTGDYVLKEGANEARRFSYQPAEFSPTRVQILELEEATAIAARTFPNAQRREDYLRKLVPLELVDWELYVKSLKIRNEIAMAGKGRFAVNTVTLTLRNFTSIPEGFDFEMPNLQISDSQGELEVVSGSQSHVKDPDVRKYVYRLKRKADGEVAATFTVKDEAGNDRVLNCTVPELVRRKLQPLDLDPHPFR